MVVRDGKGVVVKLWGGYTPKLYDDHFVEAHREEFDEFFKKGKMFGDGHFSYGAKYVEEVEFLTPIKSRKGVREERAGDEGDPYDFEESEEESEEEEETDDEEEEEERARYEEEWNGAIKTIRARVENIFGFLKNNIRALKEKFAESPRQHDALGWYAVGMYNCKM